MVAQKPTWKVWLTGIVIWCGSYLGYQLCVHKTLSRDNVGAAIVSAIVGASITWYLQLRRWRKSQIQRATN